MAKITSLDGAAWGFIRHRFVRSLGAAIYVAMTLAVISLMLPLPGVKTNATWLQTAFVMLFLVFWVTYVVSLTSGFVEAWHRRLTALFLIVGAGYLLRWFSMQAVAPLDLAAGFQLAEIQSYRPAFLIMAAAEIIFRALCVLVSLELFVHGVWQLITSSDGFLAARGWRPPFNRIQAGFPRQLGMPSYVAAFSRGGFWLSILYFIIGACNLALLATPLGPFLLLSMDAPREQVLAGTILPALILLFIGYGLSRWATRLATQQYQKVRDWDARPPIVFLRTFDQDDQRLKARGGDLLTRMPAGVARSRTLDEILLDHGTPYGPVIAIGDPRDPTPPLGAARIFVPGRGLGWQDVVTSLVSASKAVVMCPNSTEGVKWELDLISKSTDPGKVIYLANPELTRETNLDLFARVLPADAKPTIPNAQIPIAAFLDPKTGWRVLTARRVSLETYTIGLNLALQRMFGREGVEPIEPAPAAPVASATEEAAA